MGGSQVVLDYNITAPTVPGGGGGLALDLATVSYNPHPTTANCFKNAVSLVYDADAASPLSLSVLGDRILARAHKLTAVNVKSKATCGDGYVRLRSYELTYQADVDTQLPRLRTVRLFGRDGTTEAATAIPVATYSYGSASTGALQYTLVAQAPSDLEKPNTKTDVSAVPGEGTGFSTFASLIDLSGDGLLDQITYEASPHTLSMLRDWLHSTQSVSLGDGMPQTPLESRTLLQPRYQGANNTVRTWRQAIDVNGDGRIDRIDAAETPGRWVVYLNMPDPSDPGHPLWQRRTLSIQPLAAELAARGFVVDANSVPLGQRTTARQHTTRTCWKWNGDEWLLDPTAFGPGGCTGPPDSDGPETTYTDWEVTDVNGDGYPDVVFNASRVTFADEDSGEPTLHPSKAPEWLTEIAVSTPLLPDSNHIDAMLNVAGVRIGTDTQPFAAAVVIRSHDSCGVATWSAIDESNQSLGCDIVDVNGDGIADLVQGQSVYLGTGVVGSSGLFTEQAMLTLPGPLSTQRNQQVTRCAPPATGANVFTTYQTAGLRDLTGDGIPDYVSADGAGNGTVQIGTGTRFLPAIPINGMFVALSSQIEDCAGTKSTTMTGLYDIDGDGKPEVLGSDGSVNKLVGNGAVGAPDSGRLVQIDNGFGATTTIIYRSAKLLTTSGNLNVLHQVPFPEIVVGAVETTKSQTGATLLAKTQYAYGGAELVFDPVADRFRFPGYRRMVTLQIPTEQSDGAATITDHHVPSDIANPYDLPSSALDAAGRYARYLRLGRVSDVTVLAGNVGSDPATLLAANVTSDDRRIGGTHYEYDAKLLPAASSAPEKCNEMVHPYNYLASQEVSDPDAAEATKRVDACLQRGFAFTTSVESFRGEPGAAAGSAATVTTRSEVRTVDDLGRVTSVKQLGDISRPDRTDDDLCIDMKFAEPAGQNERVLSAVLTRTVTDCGKKVLASDTSEYDGRKDSKVSAGLLTAHSVDRLDEAGNSLGSIREFDTTFDAAGNPATMTTSREGTSRTATIEYDAFKLVPVLLKTEATGVPTMQISLTRDPLTLDVVSTTDPHGIQHGTTFDGCNRPVMSTVARPRDTLRVLGVVAYSGFSGPSAGDRHITTSVFTDPVPVDATHDAPGRSVTRYFDELGRDSHTETMLGDDYPGLGALTSYRIYDSFGRVVFDADPFTSLDAIPYGTT
ncbi:MAG TPA: toxin TcdB middle/N-terminal domain-containing protein, partial [Kofleriaceae bacterium]|nr:toxin TcdB middle/N-terminal domain-containing protein [Kofleriaceae bacterium]